MAPHKLEHLFGNKIINSKVFLRQEFFKLKMKDDVSLMAYLNHMESLVTQLAALQAPIWEDDQVAVLLSRIEEIPKYKDIILVLQVAGMDFHDMMAMLLDDDHWHTDTPFGQEALFT